MGSRHGRPQPLTLHPGQQHRTLSTPHSLPCLPPTTKVRQLLHIVILAGAELGFLRGGEREETVGPSRGIVGIGSHDPACNNEHDGGFTREDRLPCRSRAQPGAWNLCAHPRTQIN